MPSILQVPRTWHSFLPQVASDFYYLLLRPTRKWVQWHLKRNAEGLSFSKEIITRNAPRKQERTNKWDKMDCIANSPVKNGFSWRIPGSTYEMYLVPTCQSVSIMKILNTRIHQMNSRHTVITKLLRQWQIPSPLQVGFVQPVLQTTGKLNSWADIHS